MKFSCLFKERAPAYFSREKPPRDGDDGTEQELLKQLGRVGLNPGVSPSRDTPQL
jgi:hypothetical protein